MEPRSADQRTTASQSIFPVTGTITYDGKPLADARIRLEATWRGASRVYACDSKPNGTFAIEAVYPNDVKSGAPIGNYKVLVDKWEKYESDSDELGPEEVLELQLIGEETDDSPAPNSLISRTFNNSSTTPLKLEVKEGKYEEWRRRYMEAKKDVAPDQVGVVITHSTALPLYKTFKTV